MQRQKIIKTLSILIAAVVGLWLFISLLLPLTLPFFIAFFLAVVTEPVAVRLMKKGNLPRWLAGAICTFAVYILLFGGLFLLGKFLFGRLEALLTRLPTLFSQLSGPISHLHAQMTSAAQRLPDGLGQGLTAWVEDFFRTGAGLLEGLPEQLISFVTKLARKIPGFVLFSFTTVIASFMASAQLPLLRSWMNRALPATWRKKVTTFWHRIKTAAGGWLKAQGKLLLLTFGITSAGMLLLRIPYGIFIALGVAAVDALPVFGSGTVLIPWALLQFLQGDSVRGVVLLLLYGTVAISRATLEPKLVGQQMGLPPLVTLAAFYIGTKLCGIPGLILFPMGAAIISQFVRWGKG